MIWGAGLFIGVVVFLYRFAFFRHDDWLILGNAVLHLKDNWRFAFDTTLFYGEQRSDWFFRPLFKYGALWLHELFGLEYSLWLLPFLLLFLASAWITRKAILRLSGSSARADLFFALLLSAVPLYAGSLLWAGEGLMNCPQLFLIALSLLSFAWALGAPRYATAAITISVVSYIVSLGFKESTVFHPLFLAALAWRAPSVHSLKTRFLFLAPFLVFCAVFLVGRLFLMPFNVHYIPTVSVIAVLKPIVFIGAFPLTVLAAWSIFSGFGLKRAAQQLWELARAEWMFAPFFALSIAPYFGHGFFSSAWLLLPGFYILFFLIWKLPLPEPQAKPHFQTAVVTLTLLAMALPVLGWMKSVGWWQWHEPQRKMLDIVQKAPADIENIHVYKCANLNYQYSRFERVVAFEASLYYMWALHHPTRVQVAIHPCDTDHEELFAQSLASRKNLVLRWRFPNIEMVSPNPSFLARLDKTRG